MAGSTHLLDTVVSSAVLMASGAVPLPSSVFAAAVALIRSRWEEAKLCSTADPGLLASAEGELFSSIEVALEVLDSSPVASGVRFDGRGVPIGAGGDAAAMDVGPSVVEDAVDPSSVCVGPDRDPPTPERVIEGWNALFFVDNLESEVVSLFDRHRELAAAAYCRSSSAPVVYLFVDFDMFHAGTGFDMLQSSVLWDRWMGIVSPDRIWRGCRICVALHELPRH